ncbi:MAG TPA: glycerate kinase [Acidimicrobiales bacterium]|jgi:glycerate kinase|nr:glycerate kinase [Acidimicrobiales bacterium]
MARVVAAPDKFRGTATAREVAEAIAAAAQEAGWRCDQVPIADGGEGTLDVMAGRWRTTEVRDPRGRPVVAPWRLDGTTAVVEMARASGLSLVGGPEGNDPVAADTAGTGQLVAAAVKEGAKRVIVGVGGSATTDGGLGALRALEPHSRLHGVQLIVACDVETRFLDAATVFAPQKGATPSQVALLSRRLERLAAMYQDDYGVDVRPLPGGGAAGGLAGGLAAIGAQLVPGFDVVADAVDLAERMEGADLVVTGEGLLDEQSFHGKSVGGVVALAAEVGVPVLVVAGDIAWDGVGDPEVPCVSLVERFGRTRAMEDTLQCVRLVVAGHLEGRPLTSA